MGQNKIVSVFITIVIIEKKNDSLRRKSIRFLNLFLDDFQFTKQSKELYEEILKSLSGVNQKDRGRKRKKLEKELTSANQRIENLQYLLVDETIAPKVYRQTLNRYTKRRDQITSNFE